MAKMATKSKRDKMMSYKQTTKVRASSWPWLFDCAYRWEGEHFLDLKKPSGMRALLGTSVHHGTAVFDQGRIDHADITADNAAGAFVDYLADPGFEVDTSTDDLTKKAAEKIGLTLIGQYCAIWSPKYTFTAVEMTVEPLLIDCGGGIFVELKGTLDRSRIKQGEKGEGIADIKTGGAAVQKGVANTKGRAAQVGTYELLYEHTTKRQITAPAEIIGMKTRGQPEIATGRIDNARAVMVGTDNYPGLIEFAAQMFRTGSFYPNPNSLLCGKKYCARWSTCPYHS